LTEEKRLRERCEAHGRRTAGQPEKYGAARHGQTPRGTDRSDLQTAQMKRDRYRRMRHTVGCYAQRAVMVRSPGVEVRSLRHPAHENERDADDTEHRSPVHQHFGEEPAHATDSTITNACREPQTAPPLAFAHRPVSHHRRLIGFIGRARLGGGMLSLCSHCAWLFARNLLALRSPGLTVRTVPVS